MWLGIGRVKQSHQDRVYHETQNPVKITIKPFSINVYTIYSLIVKVCLGLWLFTVRKAKNCQRTRDSRSTLVVAEDTQDFLSPRTSAFSYPLNMYRRG